MFPLLSAFLRRNATPTLPVLGEARVGFRVKPTDLDLNLHLNNAKYLRYMDLSRLEYFVASGLLFRLLRDRTNPIVAGTEIAYLRELRLFTRFDVTAKLLGWDARHLFFEQRFLVQERVVTHAYLRLALVRDGRARPIDEVRPLLDGLDSPALPEPVGHWQALVGARRAARAPSSSEAHAAPVERPAPGQRIE